MNTLIENLNQLGERFLSLAWPMLWQSGLLMGIVFALDYLLARKLRAAVRYALWLTVLVKLLLPPALALPTGAAWWLSHPKPAPAPVVRHFTVSYDDAPAPVDFVPQSVPLPPPPPPQMERAGWLLLVTSTVSAALLLWLIVRWWQVTRLVWRATLLEAGMGMLASAKALAKRRSTVKLKVVEGRMSPAVCGLFRPVILLPRELAEKLSSEQLRAVLLHELFHLRRGDVWVNCAQALLQIVYWWHPLLWIANARIRRLREEAVDDAVMLALRDEADSYAPTLLEVAKLAFRRPLLSLGLVGIMESRSALRQRIERLVDFRAPRRAGLTFASFCVICVFSAVALPMGEAPQKPAATASSIVTPEPQDHASVKVDPEIFFRNLKAQADLAMLPSTNDQWEILMGLLDGEGVSCNPPHGLAYNKLTKEIATTNAPEQIAVFRQVIEQLNRADGKCELPLSHSPIHRKSVLIQGNVYAMSRGEFEMFTVGLDRYPGGAGGNDWWALPPEIFKQRLDGLAVSGATVLQRPRIQTSQGITATLYVGDRTNGLELSCKPVVREGFVNLTLHSTFIQGVPEHGVTNQVFSQASALDHGGFVLRSENYGGHTGSNLVTVISVEIMTNPVVFQERLRAVIKRAPATTGQTNPVSITSNGRKEILARLDHIRLDHFSCDGLPLREVLRQLAEQFRLRDPEHKGINFLINDHVDQTGTPGATASSLSGLPILAKVDPVTGLPTTTNAIPADNGDIKSILITIPNLTDVRAVDVLDAIVLMADKPIKYSIQDYAVVFSAKVVETPPLFSRVFAVDPRRFAKGLKDAGVDAGTEANSTNSIMPAVRKLIESLGVDLKSPPGKSVFYNDKLGRLFVKATEQDLDTVEQALEVLNSVPPQIHIKARFVSVPKDGKNGFGWYLGQFNTNGSASTLTGGSSSPGTFPGNAPDGQAARTTGNQHSTLLTGTTTGILTDANFRTILHALGKNKDVQILAEPEVTTSSGRQTQMHVTQMITVVTNFAFQESLTNGTSAIVPEAGQVETGPILDVVPYVLPDGYTINLAMIPSLREFLGYADPPKIPDVTGTNNRVQLPVVLPQFSTRQIVATLNLWDNQTAVIAGLPEKDYVNGKEIPAEAQKGDREILVFITATIVDPAGNRVHSDADLSFAQQGPPPQPTPSK